MSKIEIARMYKSRIDAGTVRGESKIDSGGVRR